MSQYKAICTLTWKVQDDCGADHCLEQVRDQLKKILPMHPGLDGFMMQIDLAPMKTRKILKHIKSYPADEILALITNNEERRDFMVDGKNYSVRMNSDRYHVFRESRFCAACGIEGTTMILDLNPGDSSPHFNLYAEEDGKLLLMTKDHKIPKSKGGKDELDNYVTCCAICNNLKGNFDVTYEQINILRQLYKNPNSIPRRELRDLINQTRETMNAVNQHLSN